MKNNNVSSFIATILLILITILLTGFLLPWIALFPVRPEKIGFLAPEYLKLNSPLNFSINFCMPDQENLSKQIWNISLITPEGEIENRWRYESKRKCEFQTFEYPYLAEPGYWKINVSITLYSKDGASVMQLRSERGVQVLGPFEYKLAQEQENFQREQMKIKKFQIITTLAVAVYSLILNLITKKINRKTKLKIIMISLIFFISLGVLFFLI